MKLLAIILLAAVGALPLTAQPNADDYSTISTALERAIAGNDASAMTLMEKLKTASPDLLLDNGRSPALLAIAAGNTALARSILETYPTLIETGAEIARYQWRTPFFLAVERDDRDLVDWLRQHHAKTDGTYLPFDRAEVPANALAFARSPAMTDYLQSLGLPLVYEVKGTESPTDPWTANDGNVNVRSAPDAKSPVVGKLKKGENVSYFGNTTYQTVIGGVRAYWFKIKTKPGVMGWVFGAFLDPPWIGEE